MKIIQIVSLAIAASFLVATDSQAKYCDDETDLVYYGYRYYNPTAGRWLSRDPIGEKGFQVFNRLRSRPRNGDVNPYVFVGNDSVNRWDPLGMCCKCKSVARDFVNGVNGGATFSPGFYSTGHIHLGEEINYTWYVYGNPRDCTYQISEIGGYRWSGPGGIGGSTLDGTTAWQNMTNPTYGNDTAILPDYMGLEWPWGAPAEGNYVLEMDLIASLRCTGTDAVTVTHEFPEIVGYWTMTYPPPSAPY
jgi:RHS repeat-associated protein